MWSVKDWDYIKDAIVIGGIPNHFQFPPIFISPPAQITRFPPQLPPSATLNRLLPGSSDHYCVVRQSVIIPLQLSQPTQNWAPLRHLEQQRGSRARGEGGGGTQRSSMVGCIGTVKASAEGKNCWWRSVCGCRSNRNNLNNLRKAI